MPLVDKIPAPFRTMLATLLTSKRFWALFTSTFVAIVVRLSTRFNLGIDATEATHVAALVAGAGYLYAASQGLADFGKVAAGQTPPAPPVDPVAPGALVAAVEGLAEQKLAALVLPPPAALSTSTGTATPSA